MSSIDWDRFDAQRLLADPSTSDVSLDDVRAASGVERDEFLDRLRVALAELPDPPLWFRIRFWVGDCAWRVASYFTKP